MTTVENATVSIEVTRDFGKTISDGKYITFNAPYGIGSRYYDIECEVGTPLWVECLWHQVNFTAEGFTKAEFMLPMYSWLHKKLPTGLGSNRKDGHSAFSWSSSYSIKKEKGIVTLNGNEVYSLDGKFLYSNLERELEEATPKAPKGVPFLQTESSEYGTTVSLGRWDSDYTGLLNTTVVNSCDLDAIADKYNICDDVNWSHKYISIAYPTFVGKTACVLQVDCDNNDYETTTFWWLFPNKNKWVALGEKRSYELLRQYGRIIPEWLEEKYGKGYPTKGDGWAVIN